MEEVLVMYICMESQRLVESNGDYKSVEIEHL